MELIRRLFKAPKESFFLFGPRGTGKSTWLRQTFPDAIYVDLLDQEAFRTYLARPERLGEVVAGRPQAETVIVDEIQKVPSLLDVLRRVPQESGARRTGSGRLAHPKRAAVYANRSALDLRVSTPTSFLILGFHPEGRPAIVILTLIRRQNRAATALNGLPVVASEGHIKAVSGTTTACWRADARLGCVTK